MHIKIAFYLDILTDEQIGNSPECWGLQGRDVPAVIFETQPGDVVVFNHNAKHAAFGSGASTSAAVRVSGLTGSTERRWLTPLVLSVCGIWSR